MFILQIITNAVHFTELWLALIYSVADRVKFHTALGLSVWFEEHKLVY